MKTVEEYIQEVKTASDLEWQRNGYNMAKVPTFTYTQGPKYTKVFVSNFGSKSIHCFIDKDGNLYKPAGVNAPAKGIRGNINDDKKPLLCGDFYRYR